MLEFKVEDMTCGHCVSSVTKAIKTVDPAASVDIDLPNHLVKVGSSHVEDNAIEDAIRDAGYSPERRS